jgi:hypothetical protein
MCLNTPCMGGGAWVAVSRCDPVESVRHTTGQTHGCTSEEVGSRVVNKGLRQKRGPT